MSVAREALHTLLEELVVCRFGEIHSVVQMSEDTRRGLGLNEVAANLVVEKLNRGPLNFFSEINWSTRKKRRRRKIKNTITVGIHPVLLSVSS